jgi:hypothetical protein
LDLVHCIYCSASKKANFTESDLGQLLDECREKNAKVDITGMLLFRDNTFFQIIEGDRAVIDALFEKLSVDNRHTRITKIIVESIDQRSFGEWTMGYSKITIKELAEIPGLNDFFAKGISYFELGEGRAKTLLGAFKEGKWRLSLH